MKAGSHIDGDLRELVAQPNLLKMALELKVKTYINRVSTDANPADPPSRDRMNIGAWLGWKTVVAKFPNL